MSPRHIANGQQDEAPVLYFPDLFFPHHNGLDLIQFPGRIVIPRRIKSVEYVIGIRIDDIRIDERLEFGIRLLASWIEHLHLSRAADVVQHHSKRSFQRRGLLFVLATLIAGIVADARHLPLEKLCPRWQAGSDEARDLRVLAPLLPACAAQSVCAHPPLRVSRQSFPCFPRFPLSPTAISAFHHRRYRNNSGYLRELALALPVLRRSDDPPAKIHSCRIVAMYFFRLFVRPQPKCPSDVPQHVHAFLCAFPVRRLPRTHFTTVFTAISRPTDAPSRFHALPLQSTFRFIGTKLAFNPHNSTRPPQPPAASF
jgi:hypothetical protein